MFVHRSAVLPLLAVVVTVGALLLPLTGSSRVVRSDIGSSYSEYSPFFPLLSNCSMTFEEFDRYWFLREDWDPEPGKWISQLPYQSIAALCPANCTHSVEGSQPQEGAVYGSFPYHGSSSVCLAAVHAGIISGKEGGGVYVSYFFRQDWSNTSTQTIFPFTSSLGSLSNGVLSHNVSSLWYSVPSNATEHSWTVRGRGDLVVQRRQAPFSPRAGHLLQRWRLFPFDHVNAVNALNRTYYVWLVMGGYNATAYNNEVYLGWQRQDEVQGDIEWRRLRDAPFTPRADMQGRWRGFVRNSVPLPPLAADTPSEQPLSTVRPTLYVFGGQTYHHCGLRELGECSNEVWLVNLTISDKYHFDLSWERDALVLPFVGRCEPWLAMRDIFWGSLLETDKKDHFFIMGGQLSYNDSSCSTAPQTVNEVWKGSWQHADRLLSLQYESSAPFSPRRVTPSADDPWDHRLVVCLTGGIRHTNITAVGPGIARLTGSEVSAEVWCCVLTEAYYDVVLAGFTVRCNWTSQNTASAVLAVPGAGGLTTTATGHDSPIIGGFIPQRALADWRNLRPVPSYDLTELQWPPTVNWSEVSNVTLVNSPIALFETTWLNNGWKAFDVAQPDPNAPANLLAYRRGLPVQVVMGDAELNDVNGDYHRGSSWLHAYQHKWYYTWGGVWMDESARRNPSATLHHQHMAFADEPQHSTWFVPQALPSVNTSRPRFNFALPRVQARMLIDQRMFSPDHGATPQHGSHTPVSVGRIVTSGGYSGSSFVSASFNNDWIEQQSGRCLPPDDSSFATALGPVVHDYQLYKGSGDQKFSGNTFTVGAPLEIFCPTGYHLEPPDDTERSREIRCYPNGLWMSRLTMTITRCVKDVLNCSTGLADYGGLYCEPAIPLILRIDAFYEVGNDRVDLPHGSSPRALVGLPYFGGASSHSDSRVTLLITADAVLPPIVSINVGGFACTEAVLQKNLSGNVCWNVSSSQSLCDTPGTEIVCKLDPAFKGTGAKLDVVSGPTALHAELDPALWEDYATVTSLAPVITRLISGTGCKADPNAMLERLVNPSESNSSSHLIECPLEAPSGFAVCAQTISLAGDGGDLQVSLRYTPSVSITLDCQSFAQPQRMGTDGLLYESCAACTTLPLLRLNAPLVVTQLTFGLYSAQSEFTLSFAGCPNGSRVDYEQLPATNSSLCVQCPPGSKSASLPSTSDPFKRICEPCLAGHNASAPGNTICGPCPQGTFTNQSGSAECQHCPLNSIARFEGATVCDACELNHYIVVDDERSSNGTTTESCRQCPTLATCALNGTVTSWAGAHLLIDREHSTLSTVACSWSACISAEGAQSSATGDVDTTPVTGLLVYNACGAGRWPAYSANASVYAGVAELEATSGHNVLCALCLPGYSEVSGHCIECAEAHPGVITVTALLAVLLVWVVHRLPHDWQGSATLLIVSYFVQQWALFLSEQNLPQLLSMLNFDLAGSWRSGGGSGGSPAGMGQTWTAYCAMPLSGGELIGVALLSPMLAFGVLGLIAALDVISRALLNRQNDAGVAPSPLRRLAKRTHDLIFRSSLPFVRRAASQPIVAAHQLSPAEVVTTGASQQECDVLPPSDESSWQETRERYERSCVRLMQLSYTGVAVQVFSFFHLHGVGEFGLRMLDHPSISPSSAAYQQVLPVVILLLIVVVIALPLLLTVFLFRQHRQGHIQLVKQRTAMMRAEQRWTLSDRLVLQLTAPFRAQCWWMPAYILARRAALVAMLDLVRSDSVWLWLSLLNNAAWVAHLTLKPYERRADNELESLTLLSLLLQTTVLSQYPPPYMSPLLLGVLNALLVAPLLPPFLHLGRRVFKRVTGGDSPPTSALALRRRGEASALSESLL